MATGLPPEVDHRAEAVVVAFLCALAATVIVGCYWLLGGQGL